MGIELFLSINYFGKKLNFWRHKIFGKITIQLNSQGFIANEAHEMQRNKNEAKNEQQVANESLYVNLDDIGKIVGKMGLYEDVKALLTNDPNVDESAIYANINDNWSKKIETRAKIFF